MSWNAKPEIRPDLLTIQGDTRHEADRLDAVAARRQVQRRIFPRECRIHVATLSRFCCTFAAPVLHVQHRDAILPHQ